MKQEEAEKFIKEQLENYKNLSFNEKENLALYCLIGILETNKEEILEKWAK